MRLFENKQEYELSCDDIAELLNTENGNEFGESTYRKEWASFNRGRKYEREKNLVGIAKRILSISDLHIPFQKPIETFEDYKNKIDILVLNGDLVDCYQLSKFPKQYRISPMEEIILGRQYLIDLIEYIQPEKVVIVVGNHDARFSSYLTKNLDSDVLELMPDTSLELIFVDGFHHYDKRNRTKTWYEPLKKIFTDINIEYTSDWKVKIGRTWFAHPHAYSSGTLKTCEKAMTHFFKTDKDGFDSVVLAHTHKLGQSNNGFIKLYEQGCCCDVNKLRYGEGRLTDPQQMGFAFICQDKDGNLIEDKTKLIHIE